MSERPGDFYVGYAEAAPPGLARWLRRTVLLGLLLVAGVAVMLVAAQNPFAPATFEFGNLRTFGGWLDDEPYPHLLVPVPGTAGEGGAPRVSRYALVAFGKFGGDVQVAGRVGEWASVTGTLVYRDGRTMIEVETVLTETDGPPVPARNAEELGVHTLVGEIVDSKCFLGVMNPGQLKPHKACAIRCISGGIPPVLLVRDETGTASTFLLVGGDGRAVGAEVLDMVAEPVEITGMVRRTGDMLTLAAEPSNYRRLTR